MRLLIGSLVLALTATACVAPRNTTTASAVTPGMAKKHIVPGKTTQTNVLEIFGPPNLVTHDEGRETWTYDKISQDVSSSGGFLTIVLAGYGSQRTRSSSRATMLILYFDTHERVIDYRLHSSAF